MQYFAELLTAKKQGLSNLTGKSDDSPCAGRSKIVPEGGVCASALVFCNIYWLSCKVNMYVKRSVSVCVVSGFYS